MDKIQFRRDTLANWASANPILAEGEIGYVLDDPNRYKMGDGIKTWDQLPFRGFDGTLVQETGDSETAVMSQKAVTDELAQLAGEVSVKMTNAVVNGDFRNAFTGWYFIGQSGDIENGYARVTNDGTRRMILRRTINNSQGDKVYFYCVARVSYGDIYAALGSDPTFSTDAETTYLYIDSVNFSKYSSLRTTVADNEYLGILSDGTTDATIQYLSAINLTQTFGAGNEPTKEEMDLLISTLGTDYFEGEITIPAQKVMQWQLGNVNLAVSINEDVSVKDLIQNIHNSQPTLSLIEGKLITRELLYQTTEGWAYTKPIYLLSNTTVNITTAGFGASIINKSTAEGTLIKSVFSLPYNMSSEELVEYKYIIIETGWYVLSYKNSDVGSNIFITDSLTTISDRFEQLNPENIITGVTHIKDVPMNKGFLINRKNLEKQAVEGYGYSDPLFLPKGTKIKVSTQGTDISVITESNVDGDLIKVIKYTDWSNPTGIKNISHTVSDDGYYIICYKVDAEDSDLDIVSINDSIKEEIEHIISTYDISDIDKTIDFIQGAFVVNRIINGEVDFRLYDSEPYGYSEPIYFKKGVNIAFKTAGSLVCLVTKSNQEGDLIEPMITTPGSASLLDLVDYNYTIPEEGYYIISHKAFTDGSYVKLSNISGTSIDRDEVNEIVGDYIAENAIAVNSIIQTSTSTDSGGNNTIDITLEDGSIHHINIKNGEKGEKGDTVIIGGEESYTLYNELGQNTDGAVTQKALTNIIDKGYYCGLYIYPFRAIANKNVFIYKDALVTGLKPLYNYEVYTKEGGLCINYSEKTFRLNSGVGVKEAEFFVKDRYDKIVASKKIEIKLREMPTSKLSSSAEPIDVLFLGDSIIANNINKIGVEFRRMLSTKNDTPIQSGNSILIPTNNLCNGKINLVGEMQDPSNSDNRYQYVFKLNQFLKGKRTIPFGSPSAQNARTWMSQNPFYNPDSLEDDVIGSDGFQKKVDFKWYFENICGEGKYPRLIYLAIGANDYATGDGWSGDIIPQITSQIIGVCKKMKAASNEIAGGVSNLVIKIFNHQTYPLTSAVTADYPVARARLIQNQTYDSYYNAINDDANDVKDYVDFVDCASKFDWRNGYNKSLISTNVRSTARDDLYVHETIHMNSTGAYNYADCLVDDFIVDERFD